MSTTPDEIALTCDLNEDSLSISSIYTMMSLMRNDYNTIIFKNINENKSKIDEVLHLILMAMDLSGYKLVKEKPCQP